MWTRIYVHNKFVSVNPFAGVFGDFFVDQKSYLTYSSGADRRAELL